MPDDVNNPNAGEAGTPEVAKENAPSRSDAEASPLPSADKPDQEPTGPARQPAPKAAQDGTPAAKPKKEKAPAVEDKPFNEFITQDLLPALQNTMGTLGVSDLDLKFEKQQLPIRGLDESECWQVIGQLQGRQRQFIIGFLKDDIQGAKVFCYADNGSKPSTLESFMIDERKVTLDLLVFYTVQRLNGQKWLVRN